MTRFACTLDRSDKSVALQHGLDERQSKQHSVTWLDATLVGNQRLFGAVAASDNRTADWVAHFDIPITSMLDKNAFAKINDKSSSIPTSLSGYALEDEFYTAFLCQPTEQKWGSGAFEKQALARQEFAKIATMGGQMQLHRRCPLGVAGFDPQINGRFYPQTDNRQSRWVKSLR